MMLICFLGNPGRQYEKTRHNAAWLLCEHLPGYNDLTWTSKFKGRHAGLTLGEAGKAVLLMPETFMNLSGESIAAALSFFKLTPRDLVVVHDDIELPFGSVQLKFGGGTGGHNGLRSTVKSAGTNDFWRFRIGVSRPPAGRDAAGYVLGRFSPDEEAVLDDFLYAAAAEFISALSAVPKDSPKRRLLG